MRLTETVLLFRYLSMFWLLPLPVPNWASAEAQFIPNFSLHTKFSIGGPFEVKFSTKNCLQIQTVFVFASVCCCSPCGRERLKSDSRVASDHQNRHNHHRHTFQPDRCALKLVLQTVFDLKYTLGKDAKMLDSVIVFYRSSLYLRICALYLRVIRPKTFSLASAFECSFDDDDDDLLGRKQRGC